MDEVFWIDEVGDMLEAEGVDPGRIFEFHDLRLGGSLPGGVVVTADRIKPGYWPTCTTGDELLGNIQEVIIKLVDGSIERMKPGRPIVVAHWWRINLQVVRF